MEDYKVNTNYAKALFLATENAEQQRAVLEDMRVVARVCVQNRELGVVMANPTIKECKKAGVKDFIVEQDTQIATKDPFVEYGISRKYLATLGL